MKMTKTNKIETDENVICPVFTPANGIGELKKFVHSCKKNTADHNEADLYLENNGNIREIILMLKNIDKKNLDDVSLIFSAMQILIVKIAAKYGHLINNTEELCRSFIKENISLFHSMLSSNSNAKQRRVVLKLLSSFAYLGVSLSREILNHLSLHPQMVLTLTKQANPDDPNSVRTSYIHFVLAFLLQDNLQLTKAFLEKRGALSCIFPELIYDSYDLVRMVLLAVKQHVLQKQGISKTIKLFVFNNQVIESLINLYNWRGPNNWSNGKKVSGVVLPEEKEIVTEALHDFLLTLLTSKKHGIIFQDSISDSSLSQGNNQIINSVLQKLECPWEHEKPAELVIKILTACPGLIKTQFSYVEPYLEPRVSKKWISAMKYVRKIIESINLNKILDESSALYSPIQLSNILLNACLPFKIVNCIILSSLEHTNMICRYEGIELLRTMLNKISKALEIVEKHQDKFDLFRKNIRNHIIQNIPDPDALLKIWNNINISEEETLLEILVPSKLQYFNSIIELFLVYYKIIPDMIFVDNNFDPGNFLNDLNDLINENVEDVNILKIKVIRFLLSVNQSIFDPTKKIFESALSLLVFEKDTKDIQYLLLSQVFEEYSNEIDIWIEGLSNIECSDDKIKVVQWFTKVLKSTVQNNEKYLETLSTAEKMGQELCAAQTAEEILEYLLNNNPANKNVQLQYTTVSPILCCAIKKFKKKSNPNILNFLCKVLTDVFHSQITPNIFIYLIRDFNDFQFYNYFNCWSTENSLSIESVLNFSNDCFLMKHLLSTNKIDIKLIQKLSSKYDIINAFRVTVFCLTQLSERKVLDEKINNNCKNVIIHLFEESKKYPPCFEECCKWIFSHPIVLKSFKPVHKRKQKCEHMITNTIYEITKYIKIENESDFFHLKYISSYREKLGRQLKLIFEKDVEKLKNLNHELIDIFGLNMENAVELLHKVITFDKSSMVEAEEKKLTNIGQLIPKLFQICYKNENQDIFQNGVFIKKFMKMYIFFKVERVTDLNEWEICILIYFKKFDNHILNIDNDTFTSLFQNNISSSLVQLLSYLISKNVHFASEFSKIVTSNSGVLKQAKVIFPIILNNLNYNWESKLLIKLYNTYQPKITKYLIKPEKNIYWIPENKDAVIKIIKKQYEPEICTKICQTILENGDKINILNQQYLELLEVLFSKNINDICCTKNFLLVLIFVLVNTLKKEGNNIEKINFLCNIARRTVTSLKSEKIYFEELNKSSSWPQFTRFSLKQGLKYYKNKASSHLLKVLSEICDIAYKDNGMEEYVKTMFEMTTTHSEFLNIMLKNSDTKRDLLELLWTLIQKNNSVMLSKQIPLYLAAYNATLSESDQFILMMLYYYEKNIKINKEYKPFLFGEFAAIHYSVRDENSTLSRQPSTNQFFDLFVPELIINTVTNFPINRTLQNKNLHSPLEVYDPAFYLPLFYTLLSDKNMVSYKKFIRCGALALSLIALCSTNSQIRLLAYNVLQRFYDFHLSFASSKHDALLWIQFLQTLGNGLQSASETKLQDIRLNSFIATFMARVSLIMNDHPLYALLHAFFRAKPALNLNEIPEFLNFLHSSEVEYIKQRRFILQVIRDGMKTENDGRIALKSPVFKLLYNFYFCGVADKESKTMILEIFEAVTKLPATCRLLVNDFALLPWINQCTLMIDSKDQRSIELIKTMISNISDAFKQTKTKSNISDIIQLITTKLQIVSTSV